MPILKLHARSLTFVLLPMVGNGQILQWDLMSILHFTELRQKAFLYIHDLVIIRGFLNLEDKLFVRKKRKQCSAKLGSDRLSKGPVNYEAGWPVPQHYTGLWFL